MANVSFTINSDNYTSAQSVTCYVGDNLSINYTRVQGSAVVSYYAILTEGASDVPGCTLDKVSTYNSIKGNLTGTPTTAGTYTFQLCRFRPTATTQIVKGDYLTLTVKPLAYYSNLKYDANTGVGAPPEDRYSITTDTKPADRNVIIPNTIPTLSEYHFEGWSKTKYIVDPLITGIADYKAGDTIQVPYLDTTDISVTLYAVWKAYTTKKCVKTIYQNKTLKSICKIMKETE